MRQLLIVVALTSCGCGQPQIPARQKAEAKSGAVSPYESYLPKEAPSDAKRIVHSSGISIDCPAGWTLRTIEIESFLKDYLSDQFVVEGPQRDQFKPTITVQRIGPAGRSQWEEFAKPGAIIGDGYARTQFHGEPAFTRFLAGSAKSKSVLGPTLAQQLVFRSQREWFLLEFRMRNVDGGSPYYTQPLKIIQDYFETFRYKPRGG